MLINEVLEEPVIVSHDCLRLHSKFVVEDILGYYDNNRIFSFIITNCIEKVKGSISKNQLQVIHIYISIYLICEFIGQIGIYLKKINNPTKTKIIRTLEDFKPEHKQAIISTLHYFSNIAHHKHPEVEVSVKVEEEDSIIRLIIETNDKDIIDKALAEYGQVVKGNLEPKDILNDKDAIMEFENKIRFLEFEMELNQRFVDFKEDHYNKQIDTLKSQVGTLESQMNLMRNIVGDSLQSNHGFQDIINRFLDQDKYNLELQNALLLLKNKYESGVSESDKENISNALKIIRKWPKISKVIEDFLLNATSGATGILIAQIIQSL